MSTRSTNLIALGSAAVVAIYAAGFVRTREAAARFADDGDARRPMRPAPTDAPPPSAIGIDGIASPAAPSSNVALSTPAATRDNAVVLAGTDSVATGAPARKAKSEPTATSAAATATATISNDSFATPGTTSAAAAKTVVAQAVVTPAVVSQTVKDSVVQDGSVKAAVKDSVVTWKDGVYLGWGGSRHGDIQAEVTVRGGRIVSASIAQCLTRYSCSWIETLPAQVVTRQSADVDYITGATQSANAFYYAVTDALSKAK